MGRKHKYSNRKRNKPRVIVGIVKKHFARTANVNIADYHFEIKQEVVDELKSNAQREGNELCGVLMGAQVDDNRYRISKPSAVDYSSIEDNYQTASLVVPFMIMIVVGTKAFHISVFNGKKFVVAELEIV